MLKRIKKILSRRPDNGVVDPDFDDLFYAEHNPDLQHLGTRLQLWRHYREHGQGEGRSRNRKEALEALENRYGALPADFSPAAYRLLNDDLARNFIHDHEFIRHFIQHGRQEGRPYLIGKPNINCAGDISDVVGGAWPALFRTAEFLAMASKWLPQGPLSRSEALRIFIERGIDRIAPISFSQHFDPRFYRQFYGHSPLETDAALYRHWLRADVSEGRFPNESVLLHPYIGYRSFPESFDWERYRSGLATNERARITGRAAALMDFFERGFGEAIELSGCEDFDLYAVLGDYHLRRGRLTLAAKAYLHAERADASRLSGSFLYRRGRARKAQGSGFALADFLAALKLGDAPWEAVTAAVELLIGDRRLEEAFGVLSQVRATWQHRPDFLVCTRRLAQARFDQARAAAFRLYASGERSAADAMVTQSLKRIANEIQAFEPLPPMIGPMVDGPVVMLANQDLPQCNYYRVEQKLRQFQRADLPVILCRDTEVDDFRSALLGSRAAIFYRVAATPEVIRTIAYARALGIPTYYEIDDLIFDAGSFPDSLESYEGQISALDYAALQFGVPLYRFAMSLCQTAISSTPALARYMEPVVTSGRSVLLRNGLDERSHGALRGSRVRPGVDGMVTLFYGSGTKAHNRDFTRDFGPALLRILDEYPHVRFVIVGYLHLGPDFDRFGSRIVQLGFIADLDHYWLILAACDINLAILSPGQAADCKSEIKWLEAAAAGVPSVVSSTQNYREAVTHGVDGLIVKEPAQWHASLAYLIENGTARLQIGEAARKKAHQTYSLQTGADVLMAEFARPPSEARGASLKVLICNVFFAPQSFGGATRVVENNVDYLIDHCTDIEVSLLATDEGREPAGILQCEDYRGRPLFRISPPQESLRDWRPFNPDHEALFKQVLARVKPDLVHFHCVQRLSASIVKAAFEAGIPYFVTLHDGWWISNSQFFTDVDGNIRMPSADPFDTCPIDGVSLEQAVARREALSYLLTGASKVLAVSKSFAEVYRQAGIGNVSVLENGVQRLQPETGFHRLDGRLSIGHIGDRSIHKGATLVEAVLRNGAYDRLALTMIDNTLEPDELYSTLWGQTPVLLRGPSPQASVASLYASLDVLLAPSLWPESFGLVAREALSLGVWVVASDRGAIGECITANTNGVVIDVTTPEPLARLFAQMNENPEAWRRRPDPALSGLRSADDQGRDLAMLYRELAVLPAN